jgi:heme exporter protein B
MNGISPVITLLKKEVLLEWRNRSVMGSLLLYSVLTVFLIFFSFRNLDPLSWATLFWIVMIFSSVDAVAKSFMQESQERWFYYYTLISPSQLVIAKLVYNLLLMRLVSSFNLLLFSLFIGFPIHDYGYFLIALSGGVICLTVLFTFMSVIASKAGKNTALVTILSLPIAIPLMAVIINFTKKTLVVQNASIYFTDIVLLCAINILMLVMGYLLFQFSWKE